jgi:hypothetical protein
MRQLTLCIGLLLATLALGSAWLREGEVVTLTTFDARHHPRHSRLWIVEVDGVNYLRADFPGARWVARLRARPEVEVQRHGIVERYEAVPVDDSEARAAVDAAMAKKYGLVDELVAAVRDDDRTLPVRLDPITARAR